MTRVGLVGYGMAGRQFHGPLLEPAGLELAAVATASGERAEQVHADFPEAQVVADLDDLLDVPDLDLVVIASPSGVHVKQVEQVAARGMAMVVDKPLGVDAASGFRAVQAARAGGAPVTVFQNRRYDSEFTTVRHLVDSGDLGEVVRAELRWERWRPVPKDRWRENSPPQEGGGILLDLFPHLVDNAHLMFGPVAGVYAELGYHGKVAEDTAFASLHHASGTVCHLGATPYAAAPGPRVRILGREAAYVLGSLHDEETAFAEWNAPERDHVGFVVRGTAREPVAAQPGDPVDFYRAVGAALALPTVAERQAAMPVAPLDAVHTLAVIDAARESARSGRVAEVAVYA